MRNTVALPFAGLAIAALIAGCSGSTNNGAISTGTPTPLPVPTATCTPPAGYMIQQVFPRANASNQPNLQGVVFIVGPNPQNGAAPSPLPTNWYFYVSNVSLGTTTANTSFIGFLGTPTPGPSASPSSAPTPLPTPSDAPSPAFGTNYIVETGTIGTFAVNTTFKVYLANTNCNPGTDGTTGLPFNTFTTNATDLPSPTPTATATATAT